MNINESLLNKLKAIRALNESDGSNFSFNTFTEDIDDDFEPFDTPSFGEGEVAIGKDFDEGGESYTWDKSYSNVVSTKDSNLQLWSAENRITDDIVYFIVDPDTSEIQFGPFVELEDAQNKLDSLVPGDNKLDTDTTEEVSEVEPADNIEKHNKNIAEDLQIMIHGVEQLPENGLEIIPDQQPAAPVIEVPAEKAPLVNPVDSQLGCVVDTATKVMEAYQNANKWMDILKEFLFTDMGCPFFSSYIHNLAHTMPVRFDKFGDILHTIDMRIPYPATQYIPQEPSGIDDVFNLTFMILDAIKTALNDFIKCTDENYHGMSCAAETLLNDIEGEYVPLYKMRKAWAEYQEPMRFDRWVGTYAGKRADLNESLNESKVSHSNEEIEKCAKSIADSKNMKLCQYDDIDEVVEFVDGEVGVCLCDDNTECTEVMFTEDEFWSHLNESLTESTFTFNNFEDWYDHYSKIWNDCEESKDLLEIAFNAGLHDKNWDDLFDEYKEEVESMTYMECAFDAGRALAEDKNTYEEALNEANNHHDEFPQEYIEKITEVFNRNQGVPEDPSNKILNTWFEDYYGDHYDCYIVECDDSNAFYLGQLWSDLNNLADSCNFGYEKMGNNNGFYGKTYIFYEFSDESEDESTEECLTEAEENTKGLNHILAKIKQDVPAFKRFSVEDQSVGGYRLINLYDANGHGLGQYEIDLDSECCKPVVKESLTEAVDDLKLFYIAYTDNNGSDSAYVIKAADRVAARVAFDNYHLGQIDDISEISSEELADMREPIEDGFVTLDANVGSSLTEDTVKQGKVWVNKGDAGTHGEFKTKKEADAQRRAMFSNGYTG